MKWPRISWDPRSNVGETLPYIIRPSLKKNYIKISLVRNEITHFGNGSDYE